MVKNSPAMRRPGLDPWVGKISLEKGMVTHSSIPAWRIPVDRGAWQATVHGVTESDMTEQLSLYCMTHIHKVQWLVVIVLSTYNVTCSVLSAFSSLSSVCHLSLSACSHTLDTLIHGWPWICSWLNCLVAQLCPILCDPVVLCPCDFPGKNTGAGCHFLLQGVFLTQGSNPCLLHWQVDSLPLNHKGSPVG